MSQDNDSYEAGLSRIDDTVEQVQNTQLDEKGKQFQTKASIEKRATEFKFIGNRKQFEFKAQVDKFTSRVAVNADNPQKVREVKTK